jgi:hypothetical protein
MLVGAKDEIGKRANQYSCAGVQIHYGLSWRKRMVILQQKDGLE